MINDLKDLKALLKLCRSQGVTEIKLQGVEFKLGDLPIQPSKGSVDYAEDEEVQLNPYDGFPQDILSPGQLEHYAKGGLPEDDPFLKGKTA